MSDDQYRELISRVVREVLARLSDADRAPTPEGPAVCVACSAGADADALASLGDLMVRGVRVGSVACGRGASRALLNVASRLSPTVVHGEVAPLPAQVAVLVMPEFSLADGSKLALGILDDSIPHLAWQALDRGVPVIATAGSGFVVDQRGPRQRLADSRRTTCVQFGVKFVDADSLVSTVVDTVATSERSGSVHVASSDAVALFTESMALELSANAHEVVLPSTAIVTPLAQDALRRRGITIRRRD